MSSRVSVIIPNLDSPLLGATLEALVSGNELAGCEVLVVGSDRPGQAAAFPAARLIETEEPLNPGAARNRGVAGARGERLLFTDADCRPLPGWIEGLCRRLDRTPVVGGAVDFDLGANRWAVADNIASFHELMRDRPVELVDASSLGSLNLGVTRAAWSAVGPFDEKLTTSEDLDWVLRARRAGLEIAFDPALVVEHAAVRSSREALRRHAAWYGSHFHAFRRRHPGVFDRGPTWRGRRRLAAAMPLKAVLAAATIYARHRRLWRAWRAFPGVVAFKRAWYRAILENWDGD